MKPFASCYDRNPTSGSSRFRQLLRRVFRRKGRKPQGRECLACRTWISSPDHDFCRDNGCRDKYERDGRGGFRSMTYID